VGQPSVRLSVCSLWQVNATNTAFGSCRDSTLRGNVEVEDDLAMTPAAARWLHLNPIE